MSRRSNLITGIESRRNPASALNLFLQFKHVTRRLELESVFIYIRTYNPWRSQCSLKERTCQNLVTLVVQGQVLSYCLHLFGFYYIFLLFLQSFYKPYLMLIANFKASMWISNKNFFTVFSAKYYSQCFISQLMIFSDTILFQTFHKITIQSI